MNRCLVVLAIGLAGTGPAWGHEVRPARLIVTELSAGNYLVRWKVPAMGNSRLAIDPVFELPCVAEEPGNDGYSMGASVSTWSISCPGGLAGTRVEFVNLPSTMVDVLVQISFLDGREYTALVRPSMGGYTVPVRESESSVFRAYLTLGVQHIAFGWDHLLFVLGLILLVRDRGRLIGAITGFTIAHSVTLALAMLGFVILDGRPVEAIVALSIVFLAVEVRRFRRTGVESFALRRPWMVSAAIGLVHGLGFAGALSEYGLPAYAEALSLFAFNLGVEIGQLGFVALVLLAGFALQRLNRHALPLVQTAAVWLIGVSGSFWLVERIVGFYT